MKLEVNEFMDKVKTLIGDRDDDEVLSFLEDCKDTITSEKDDYKTKYEEVVKEKDELDKAWRTKYKERFYSDNTPPKEEEKGKMKKDPFDTRSEEQIKAESITIDSLFTESEE